MTFNQIKASEAKDLTFTAYSLLLSALVTYNEGFLKSNFKAIGNLILDPKVLADSGTNRELSSRTYQESYAITKFYVRLFLQLLLLLAHAFIAKTNQNIVIAPARWISSRKKLLQCMQYDLFLRKIFQPDNDSVLILLPSLPAINYKLIAGKF